MKKPVSRREFVGMSAVAAGAAIAGRPIVEEILPSVTMRAVTPRERVRFGIIGVGMQGNGLLNDSIKLPEVECVAACDLYDGRHVLAREIAGAALPVTRNYRELLTNPNVDALIVAVPDHWHRQIVIDAVNAGKDVYCEKPFSHTPADGVAMVAAAKKTDRIVQVGSQRVSSPICAKAREMLAQGVIGDLTLVEGWLGRNDPCGAWQYTPPPDLSPANLDWDTWLGRAPKRAFDPIAFARWRCWREYGTGVAGDLLVHLISGMMYMLDVNRPPTHAMAAGGIRRWKDGRNMPDVHATVFYYDDLPVYMRLNQGTAMPEAYRFQGSKGVLEMTSDRITVTPQSGKDEYPCYYAYSYPRAMREEFFARWHAEHDPKPGAASMPTEVVTYRWSDFDDTVPHLWNFFEAVRTRKPVVEDAVFGHNAALACHMANESYFRKTAVTWDPASQTIRT